MADGGSVLWKCCNEMIAKIGFARRFGFALAGMTLLWVTSPSAQEKPAAPELPRPLAEIPRDNP
jgi:hypothetical protein